MASDRVLDARSERGDEGQRQQQLGEGEEDVGDAHENAIGPAADIAGDGADDEPDRRAMTATSATIRASSREP